MMRKETPREAADWMAATSEPPRSLSGSSSTKVLTRSRRSISRANSPKRSERSISPAARGAMRWTRSSSWLRSSMAT